MEELKDHESVENQEINDEEEEYELSHTDKMVGVITEPGNMFTETARFKPKTVDWIIPVLLVIVVAILSNVLMMSNDAIRYSIIEKQMTAIEENFQKAVDSGSMTQEQADERLDQTRNFMENKQGTQMIFSIIGILIFTFIVFFIVSGVFFLIAKFGLKGEGSYTSAMVAYGLPYYIVAIQVIVMVIAALALNRFFTGTSVGDFIGSDKSTFAGFLLGKLDVFSIWFYAVISIGFAKMFKSTSTGKYYAVVFGLWIGFSILLFFGSKAIPFLGNFIR